MQSIVLVLVVVLDGKREAGCRMGDTILR